MVFSEGMQGMGIVKQDIGVQDIGFDHSLELRKLFIRKGQNIAISFYCARRGTGAHDTGDIAITNPIAAQPSTLCCISRAKPDKGDPSLFYETDWGTR